MKKTIFFITSVLFLSGCAAGITNSEPIQAKEDLKNVCVNEKDTRLRYSSKELVAFITNSLSKKQISSEVYTKEKTCKYLLSYSIAGKNKLIIRGKLRLSEKNPHGTYESLGEVSYKYRGEEKEIVKQTGIQGQIDKMVNELFKNN